REGLMTTGIALVRENAASMQPPRTLWVSFPLGRPLGNPADPAFQHRVIAAALELLARESGPVLEDFPEDAPATGTENAPACPVSFTKMRDTADSWRARLAGELTSLVPWYDLGRRRRQGRTLVGVSDSTAQENAAALGALLDEGRLPVEDLTWFKHAIEDLKVFYVEALTAQPGDYDPQHVARLLWKETTLGAALIEFYRMFRRAEDNRLKVIARMIVPREAVEEATGEEIELPAGKEPMS
ncbi:MAG: hypothetical protein AB7I04_22520, partial [Pseudomonadales bacterium]